MRIAVIDLGTNSVRFDVHQLGPGEKVSQLHREKLMIRLGQGVFLDGKLDKNAMRRTLHAFSSFKRTSEQLRVNKIVAFGTSALREATDSSKLLHLIEKRTGIDVRVISGEEEAKLISLGILAHEKQAKGRFALVDIGGGSTEITVCSGKKIFFSSSFPLGTARLQQIFLKRSPPKPESIKRLRSYLRSVLSTKLDAAELPKVDRILGSSGTIRTLARIMTKSYGAAYIERGELGKTVRAMSEMNTTQLLNVQGMESKRVDMIVAGAILFEECMSALNTKKSFTTEYSLRDGILEEEVDLLLRHRNSHVSFHLNDLYEMAGRFGSDIPHLKKTAQLADTLFTKLKKAHKLDIKWKNYLIAAVILRDVGQSVAFSQHEDHSYYIIIHADLPLLEKWEIEFIAQLCLHHEGNKADLKELAYSAGDKEEKQAFLKLLTLLRLVDALDVGLKTSTGTIAIRRVSIRKNSVTISFGGKTSLELELLRLERKKLLFEAVFNRTLVLR